MPSLRAWLRTLSDVRPKAAAARNAVAPSATMAFSRSFSSAVQPFLFVLRGMLLLPAAAGNEQVSLSSQIWGGAFCQCCFCNAAHRAFKSALLGAAPIRFPVRKQHAYLAVNATRSFNRCEGRTRMIGKGHGTHHDIGIALLYSHEHPQSVRHPTPGGDMVGPSW